MLKQELQEMSNTIPTSYVFMLITCLKNRFLIFLLARTTINLKRQILKISQVIDSIHKRREVHVRTKKAKDGFLFVNKYIMDHVTNLNCELGKMKVLYIYNNKEVKTKEDVMSVLRLRKKSIQISEITQDEQSGLITVYVIDQ